MMNLVADRYSGATIEHHGDSSDFEQELVAILEGLELQKLLWITVRIEDSELIPLLVKHGFIFYQCEPRRM